MMISCYGYWYDVISSRWSSIWKKMHVFFSTFFKKTFFNDKSKSWDKMKRITYLCVILHVKHKRLSILAAFTRFLILCKIQDGNQDDHYVWWRHRPPAALPPVEYTSSCREVQMLSTESKIFSKYWDISRTLRRGPRVGVIIRSLTIDIAKAS